MKRVSRLHRQHGHGHRAASSESSSSVGSMTANDGATWEVTLDNLSLVRRPSLRSNESTSPSRDRLEHFGKAFFHRRARSKRGGSSPSSSTSSVYSVDDPLDNGPASPKESFIPAIFSRRKPSRDEPAAQRKLQISGPFNFQHLAHRPSPRNLAADGHARLEPATCPGPYAHRRAAEPSTASRMAPPSPSTSHLPLAFAEDRYDNHCQTCPPPSPLVPRQMSSPASPSRYVNHARSENRHRACPPRALRLHEHPPSSARPITPSSSPSVPLRFSRRQSACGEFFDLDLSARADRPPTTGGFCRPQPFSPFASTEQLPKSSPSYDDVPPSETELPAVAGPFHDVAWPLSSPSQGSHAAVLPALPDVPEEEEGHGPGRRSRLSLISNNSSLRASQSVPLMRSMPPSHRPMSGTSDTLGCLDMSPPDRTVHSRHQSGIEAELSSFRENWEDDIDYCYEHEAEANCDYEWGRPSFDAASFDAASSPHLPSAEEGSAEMVPDGLARKFSAMTCPSRQVMPSLSPASQTSIGLGHEVVTPTSNMGVTNNFSLPRGDKTSLWPMELKFECRTPETCGFRESQVFALSPSSLVPPEYQQQLVLHEDEGPQDLSNQSASCQDDYSRMHNLVASYQRYSTSTTTTASTSRSNSTGKRHMSTTSSQTTLTRYTASNTSLNKLAATWADEQERPSTTNLSVLPKPAKPDLSAAWHVIPEQIPATSAGNMRNACHKSHASEPLVSGEAPPFKLYDLPRPRRQRARTTSLSSQAQPVEQSV
ncbi:hypothetical protein RJ55_01193 [Drechmeria coniospora]|nr:hypothetical protein RJ55_01193 [Drechmeria coniospora]